MNGDSMSYSAFFNFLPRAAVLKRKNHGLSERNQKINHIFTYGVIYYIGNYTEFSIQRLNSKSIG